MHKFHLGERVMYSPPRGTDVPPGAWIVAAKLPERNGECYYRASEVHERVGGRSQTSLRERCIRSRKWWMVALWRTGMDALYTKMVKSNDS